MGQPMMRKVNITISRKTVSIPQLWRVRHWIETGNDGRSRPEFELLDPEHKTEFGRGFQLVSYQINTPSNPNCTRAMDREQWRVLWGSGEAWMNGTGYNEVGDPRADWVNMRDTTFDNPKLDKARVPCGALVTGKLEGEWLWMETLRVQDATPSLEWLIDRPWLLWDAVVVGEDGRNIRRFPQNGNGESRVFVVLPTTQAVRINISKLEMLPTGYDYMRHDPYRVP